MLSLTARKIVYVILVFIVLFLIFLFKAPNDNKEIYKKINDHFKLKSEKHNLHQLNESHSPKFDPLAINCETNGWKRRVKPAYILDGFLFNGEFDILSIRLGELDSVVDFFIILEASMTFSQAPKPITFDGPSSAEFSLIWGHQLVHYVVDFLPNNTAPFFPTEWFIRSSLREAFMRKVKNSPELSKLDPNDIIVLISDVDEVPCAEKIAWLKYCHTELPAHMELEHFFYYNLLWKKNCTLFTLFFFP